MNSQRRFFIGFGAGFAVALFAMLGLLFSVVELAVPILIPARGVLAPFSEYFATMPGMINIFVLGILNGCIYGAAFMFAGFIVRK